MSDNFPGRLRFQLILDKFQVVKIEKGKMGQKLTLNLGNSVTAVIPDCPAEADVRVGDLLTFYTEVLSKRDIQ